MSSTAEFVKLGKELGYEGERLQQFVENEKAEAREKEKMDFEREQRRLEREERKEAAERLEKEKEKEAERLERESEKNISWKWLRYQQKRKNPPDQILNLVLLK